MRWPTIILGTLFLLRVTGPDNQVIFINPNQIVSVRAPRRADVLGPGIHCLVHTTDGKYIAVIEECNKFVIVEVPEERR